MTTLNVWDIISPLRHHYDYQPVNIITDGVEGNYLYLLGVRHGNQQVYLLLASYLPLPDMFTERYDEWEKIAECTIKAIRENPEAFTRHKQLFVRCGKHQYTIYRVVAVAKMNRITRKPRTILPIG